MSELHIVTGAGPVGTTIAEQLAGAGQRVRILTRSGSGPEHPLIERRRVDVTRTDQLSAAAEGAVAIYHCTHGSRYAARAWWDELPGTEQNVLSVAGRVGAVVVFPESLYSYGPVDRPMVETMPRAADFGKPAVRAALLRAREESPTPTVSVAAADFIGPHVRMSHAGERMVPNILGGRAVQAFGRIDLPHSFTYMPDLAAAMIKAAADRTLWNSFLHAPTAPAVSIRELVAVLSTAAGGPAPRILAMPTWALRAAGLMNEMMRELAEMNYQFDRPFHLDSTASEHRLGLRPTPLEEVAAGTVNWWKTVVVQTNRSRQPYSLA
ncbi:NAD-dependent epimerase/dehydratase family protein [Nocardia sp. CDC159]|uniref:NAD-dependent epimerase/dehydratase family protein n=1 Tax=Nocardia pulmonis TaxID=2951408 RepID=A0A9X2EES7_9NOCA|nr:MULTISPECIES: NAD-dependent epimerase/dehydratase family protein [Nocardia]MCM6777678.1 NAD-dependent epimerase/dehydratase family protein [Nocardia pulmonis]MCM6790518.1 NAD-dependent epimerase/dehydratase family protein [Nocardia sp. CDC159]